VVSAIGAKTFVYPIFFPFFRMVVAVFFPICGLTYLIFNSFLNSISRLTD
jgi:hypothetical protein